MLVHAHPDDETSQTGATLARYAAEGHVTLVTCTLGESGDIVADDLRYLTADTLGAHRLTELDAAMAELGVTDYVRLGGDYAYRDSGMQSGDDGSVHPLDELHDDCFWRSDLLAAASDLVALIRDRRPQVIATYDTIGGYGHPDHVQAHRVTMYAYQLASVSSFRPDLGPAWQISRLLWTTWDAASLPDMVEAARPLGLLEGVAGWFDPEGELPPMFASPESVAARVSDRPWSKKVAAALQQYRSQVVVTEPWWQFVKASPEIPRFEAYKLIAGVPYPPGDGPADDLFAGLALTD
jgi:N-acetyl-1-D-myo-inositol-2-amino-2-deoxy-alpha-D-glucopyranoside deacetylase